MGTSPQNEKKLLLVQARMSSARLPGKVLMPMAGIPILQHITNALFQGFSREEVLVVTSDHASDSAIADFCQINGILVWRGSLENVALRFYDALVKFQPLSFARICADSPLFDYRQATKAFELFNQDRPDLVTTVGQNFPSGLNIEVVNTEVFLRNYPRFHDPGHFEHVTRFFYENPETFQISRMTDTSLSLADKSLKLSVDTQQDLLFLEKIFASTGPNHFKLTMSQKCKIAHSIN